MAKPLTKDEINWYRARPLNWTKGICTAIIATIDARDARIAELEAALRMALADGNTMPSDSATVAGASTVGPIPLEVVVPPERCQTLTQGD